MSTVHADQDVVKHIVDAINRLKSLQHVHVTKELTSHYNYGTEEPYIRDRFRIEMGAKTKDIRCQVVFDSSNYYSPPDIIFDKSVTVDQVFDVEEQSALLPADDWDLKNENCLYNWLEKLVGRLKRPPKSPSPSPPPRKTKKNWGIFNLDDDSDDDLIIPKEKAGNADNFILTESSRRSTSSKSRNKRPAINQNDQVKDTKRLKKINPIGEFKSHNVIDLDEEMIDSSVNSSHVDTDIELKEERNKTKRQCRNPYIDEASLKSFEFDDKSKDIELKEENKTKPQSRNPYIDETSTIDFDLNAEDKKAERSMTTEKRKPHKRNPYIDEASTIDFEFNDTPKDFKHLKKNPYIDDFEHMDIDKPKVKKPKTIDLMRKTKRLTQGPSKVAAMRIQKETQWGNDFMALWRRKFQQHIMKMDEKDAGSLTLYLVFEIDKVSDDWIRYMKVKEKRLMEFKEAQGVLPEQKFAIPKPLAPMLIHLELMSSTRLKVTLISVINTSEQASSGIDSIDVTYDLIQENSVGSELTRIKKDIKKQAIHFHLFQTKLVD